MRFACPALQEAQRSQKHVVPCMHGRRISSMDIPLDMTGNVISVIANSFHGAIAFYAQIFADKVLWAIH
jgi:hypothetical protein